MTTALELIEDAFDDIEVKSSETGLSTAEIAIGIRRLNRIATQLDANGISVGYTVVKTSADVLTIPDWAEDLFIALLAVRLAPGFGMVVTQSLAIAVTAAMAVAERNLVNLGSVIHPNTLPLGAGNTTWNNVRQYFHEDLDDDLATNNGSAVTTDQSIQIEEN